MRRFLAAVALTLLIVAAAAAQAEHDGGPPLRPREPEDHGATIEARARDWFRRHGDQGRIDPERMRALVRDEYARSLRTGQAEVQPFGIGGSVWSNIGPNNIAGRVRSMATHPTTAGTVYVGAATGGVWKTTNSGATWTNLTDSLADLSVGAIALAPSAPNTIYLGTGEPVGSGIPGYGFLSSTDGGATWNFPGTGVLSTCFWKLSVNPGNPQDVLAATCSGGFRSTNGGATWTPWTVPPSTNQQITDIARDPSQPATLYAAACGSTTTRVLKSTDGGSTWVDFSTGLPVTPAYKRLMLAIDSTGTVLYTSFALSGMAYVYKSTSGGAWANTAAVDPSGLFYGQDYYNNVITIAPGGSSTVIVCGGTCAKTTTGGGSWARLSPSSGGYHVDIHAVQYDTAGTLYLGTDGGVYTSTDGGNTMVDREAGMVTTQYYAIFNDPVNLSRVYGGTQDNGSSRRDDATTAWSFMTGSDGQQCAVNANNPPIAYTTNQTFSGGNHLWRTKDPVKMPYPLFIQLAPPYESAETSTLPFYTQFAIDPVNPNFVYTATTRLWKSITGGDTWVPLPTTMTDGLTWNSGMVYSIAIARSDHSVMMVAKDYDIYRSTDGGLTWRRVSIPVSRFVNNVEIDPWNPSVAWAALATTSGSSVYTTADGGASWTVRSTGLPKFSADVIRVDPTDTKTIYCGTDVGVYRSTDSGATWTLFGTGMPKAPVYDIRIANDGTVLRAGTHGRGVWELQIPAPTNHAPSVTISSPATQTVARNTTLTLTGTTSDLDEDSLSVAWSFPDTWERTQTTASGIMTTSTSVGHTFTRAGIWPVTLSATDEHGTVSAATVVITVNEDGDTCASPIAIPNSGTIPLTVTANSETWTQWDATDPVPSCYGYAPFYSGWFTFTAPVSATYEFSTCGSGYETVLAAYSGACGSLTQLACNYGIDPNGTNGCAGGARISVPLSSGQPVKLFVSAVWRDSGQGPLAVTCAVSGSTAPRVTRVAATAGSSTGGTPITLYGSNFAAGATVAVGGTPATSVNVLSPYILSAVTPAHTAGTVDVAVTTATQTGRLAGGFTYEACNVTLGSAGTNITATSTVGSVGVTASPGCLWTAVSDSAWLLTTSSNIGNGLLQYTALPNPLVSQRVGKITIADKLFTVTQAGVQPYNLTASAASTTSIHVSWFSSMCDHFEIWRNDGSGWALAGTATIMSFDDGGRTPDRAYVYKVRAVDSTAASSAFTTPDAATTFVFSDDPLQAHVTIIKAAHILELRHAIDALRAVASLGPGTYTGGTLSGSAVQLAHVTELRTALDPARAALQLSPVTWTSIAANSTIMASHFTEIRNAVK